MIRVSGILCALALCCLPAGGRATNDIPAGGAPSEVVVSLASPALAGRTGVAGRGAAAAIDREQARFAAALRDTVPTARIRWRYRIVLNGAAVVVPRAAIPLLAHLPGVKSVDTGAAYALAPTTATGKRAATKWQTGLPNQGAGMKIGIIDDGVDQRHPYFSPAGYAMPVGFPKGQVAYTTAKVIVARAFPPPGATWKNAGKPFDPSESSHGTHVAGIAAGDPDTPATGGERLSGVAPMAYIGNYKALTIPTDGGLGLNGNAAEIVAAIEAAVADGMDVINLSIGEPEVEPSRDLVALAIDAAAEAGVVPVVAAGNDFDDFGQGSLASPGTAERAITVAAVTGPVGAGNSSLASFSSSGPTALSLRLKPDLSAPGVDVLSSAPDGEWEALSGTSMATPQVAGAAALLLERHPAWSVAELKAALIGSGSPVEVDGQIAAPTRGGGGLADPLRADAPLVLASPASVSFGFVRPGVTPTIQVGLTDAGGGAGTWDATVETITAAAGAGLVVASAVSVPGTLDLSPTVSTDAAEGDLTGFVRLTRGTDVRRIPFWLRVVRPRLAAATAIELRLPGLHVGDTRGNSSLASRYRYPDVPTGSVVSAVLAGPEQVFRVTFTKPAANFGVVIVRRGKGARVEPRVVSAGDENRLTGYAALPINLNPYLAEFDEPVLAAGAVRPLAGSYDIVFDSPTRRGAGSYMFRYWIDDTRPPIATLEHTHVRLDARLVVRVADTGSGVDPATVKVTIDGLERSTTPSFGISGSGTLRIPTIGLRRGNHRFRLQVSDYQESRNMEDVPPILPNTKVLATTIVIR
jgi:subtilisin family serine protease